jgi:dTDP-4-amino-4,6-dideoxygalactose transaminase
MSNYQIPFINLQHTHACLQQEMKSTFDKVYNSNWYVLGQELEKFESQYALLHQTNYAIGVSNGLDALQLCLKALNIKPGDEVIVPSNTYIATALAVTLVGATPIFVEPNPYTYNIDPEQIKKAITKQTKAIIPVHLYGQACEMNAIMNIATNHQIPIIEDNAQAHLSSYNQKITGSWGIVNATSFYPTKNLGALGDGGAITTSNSEFKKQIEQLRNYGSSQKYHNEVIGHNMRLDELQASFLNIKLQYLSHWTLERKNIAEQYLYHLKHCSEIVLPQTALHADHVYHLFVIRTQQRNELQNYLKENGIETLVHYPIPPHLQKCYGHLGYQKGDFPIAEELVNTSLSLPLWPGISQEQVEQVCKTITSFYQQ